VEVRRKYTVMKVMACSMVMKVPNRGTKKLKPGNGTTAFNTANSAMSVKIAT